MKRTAIELRTTALSNRVDLWVEQFLIDRKAQGLSDGTVEYYRKKLTKLLAFFETRAITNMSQIDPPALRSFLLYLQEGGHNSGGQHAHYRAARAFLLWFEEETEPEGWRNPIKKVKAPKLEKPILEPINTSDLKALLAACSQNLTGVRDRALFLFLLDSGARASEALALNIEDLSPTLHSATIREGKGGKGRIVFIGKKTRRAIRGYLKERRDSSPALWASIQGKRLSYEGLRQILLRRSRRAKLSPAPTLHSFRRSFALNCLRSGMDIYSLQSLLGHSDLQTLRQYLKQTEIDLEKAHSIHSPVDKL